MIRAPLTVRLAITAWTILLVAVGFRVALAKPGSHSVVPIFAHAASRWIAGEDVYAPSSLDVFLYSPGFAAAFSSFDPLPPKVTELLWRALSVLVLLASLKRLALATKLTRPQTGRLFALAAVLAVPCVNNGQPNIVIAGLITFGFALVMENRATPAALALALATGIKLYPLAALLLAVVAVPRLGIKAVPFVIAAFAMPFLLQSPEYVFFEYGRLAEAILGEDRTDAAMIFRVPHDWTILPRLMLGIAVPATVAKVVSVFAGLSFAFVVHRSREKCITAFSLAGVWMTLFGPATEIPTYFLAAPAAAWWCATRPGWRTSLAAVLLVAPIVRGMFPTSEVFACRTAAPCGALVLGIAAVSTALSHQPARTILVRQRVRSRSAQLA